MGIQPHPVCTGLSQDKQGESLCVCKGVSLDSYNASTSSEPWLVSVKSCFAPALYVGDASAADTFRLFRCLKKKDGGVSFHFWKSTNHS